MELLYKTESYNIVGAAMDVYNELGSGFLEPVYQEALEKEFLMRNLPYRREASLTIYYKNEPLLKQYIADFICYNNIIVELKALDKLNSNHEAQVINYLKASKMELGLLINFGSNRLEYKRLIREYSRNSMTNKQFADKGGIESSNGRELMRIKKE